MRLKSLPLTKVDFLRFLFCLCDLFAAKWETYAWERLSLPLPVTLTRLAKAFFVFIFGMMLSSCYFFFGVKTTDMVRPSMEADLSTMAISATASMNSFMIF